MENMNIAKKFYSVAAVVAAAAVIFLLFGRGKQPENASSDSAQKQEKNINLNGDWSLKFWQQPEKAVRTPTDSKKVAGAKTIPAKVPGNVELDLFRAKIIPNPETGDNSYALRKYEAYQWQYSRTFPTPKLAKGERAILKFEGLDTFADIFVNGKKVGESANMLIAHSFDITDALSANKKNTLDVIIRSAIAESNNRKVGAITSAYDSEGIRKAPHMYGWDIMPRLLSAGIWRDAKVEIRKPAAIDDAFFMTVSANPEKKEATLAYRIWLRMPLEIVGGKAKLEGKLIAPDGKTAWAQTLAADRYTLSGNGIHIKDAQLWWPRGYGDSPLYRLELRLISPDGKVLDTMTQNVGLRTVELKLQDIPANGEGGDFSFYVNGRKIYIKGTNWVPLDALHSRDGQHLEKTLKMAVDLNCNMLRCWGGNVYESEEFFDFCDKNGILVWQDFTLACTTPMQTDEFAKEMEIEARAVIEKFRKHPSLALWAGNNENDSSFYWLFENNAYKIDPTKERTSRQVLPAAIYELDPTRPYLPSSPYISKAVFEGKAFPSESHLWGPRGYYKAPYYTSVKEHFVSEIGYHGCPNRESLEKMFDKKYVYPWTNKETLEWNKQWNAKAVTPFESNIGKDRRNYLMTNQISKVFTEVPRDLDDFIFASQTVQAEAKKYFIEFWRTGKPYRNGILWWNLRDGWPIVSDAITDYYFSKKLAYYYIKRVQENAIVAVNDNLEVIGVNDTFGKVGGKVKITDIESGKTVFEKTFDIPENGKTEMGIISDLPADQGMLLIEYEVDGKKQLNHYLYGKPPFKLSDYKKWQKALKIDRK